MLPGTTVTKDPNEALVYEWDWTAWLGMATIASQAFTVTPLRSTEDPAALTVDNVTAVSGNQKYTARLVGGTLGVSYRVTQQITTNESPDQVVERSIIVEMVNK